MSGYSIFHLMKVQYTVVSVEQYRMDTMLALLEQVYTVYTVQQSLSTVV